MKYNQNTDQLNEYFSLSPEEKKYLDELIQEFNLFKQTKATKWISKIENRIQKMGPIFLVKAHLYDYPNTKKIFSDSAFDEIWWKKCTERNNSYKYCEKMYTKTDNKKFNYYELYISQELINFAHHYKTAINPDLQKHLDAQASKKAIAGLSQELLQAKDERITKYFIQKAVELDGFGCLNRYSDLLQELILKDAKIISAKNNNPNIKAPILDIDTKNAIYQELKDTNQRLMKDHWAAGYLVVTLNHYYVAAEQCLLKNYLAAQQELQQAITCLFVAKKISPLEQSKKSLKIACLNSTLQQKFGFSSYDDGIEKILRDCFFSNHSKSVDRNDAKYKLKQTAKTSASAIIKKEFQKHFDMLEKKPDKDNTSSQIQTSLM